MKAVLVTVTAFGADGLSNATTVMSPEAPTFRVDPAHNKLRGKFTWQMANPGLCELPVIVKLTGKVSVTVTSDACEGPEFVISIVNVTLLPAATIGGFADLLIVSETLRIMAVFKV